jgi:hypothetical protein
VDSTTARGAITIRTSDGVPIGHGWGEVRVGRDPSTGLAGVIGEVREMTWSTDLAPTDEGQSYRIGFHGGPSFVGVFDGPFPDTARRRARFRPSGTTTDPIGPRSAVWLTRFPARRA